MEKNKIFTSQEVIQIYSNQVGNVLHLKQYKYYLSSLQKKKKKKAAFIINNIISTTKYIQKAVYQYQIFQRIISNTYFAMVF